MALVLVVDDREINRELSRRFLGKSGHEVLCAGDGAAALELIRRQPPEVVVTDVLMPGMDGYELARAIRADPAIAGIPIIFYTANYLEREAEPIAAACGVSSVVIKTGDSGPLIEAVNSALGQVPKPEVSLGEGEFNREHLRVINTKLIEKLHELEEQSRLQQLVAAAIAVSSDLSLPAILQRIVDAARSLVEARYAGLGVLDGDHRFSTFVHSGFTAEQAGQAGALPDGRGVPSVPAEGAGPVRLKNQALHSTSLGFPDEPAEMRTYLGVPITIGAAVYGTLFLAEKNGPDGFTPSDEDLMVALASAGGTAISNAQHYDDARRMHEWLSASADITSTLLAADPTEALELVARGARRVAGADIAWIELASDDTNVLIGAADGAGADDLRGRILRTADAPLFAETSTTGRPLVIGNAIKDGRLAASAFDNLAVGPLLVVPLAAEGRCLGALLIGNEYGRTEFTPLDLTMATTFAGHAAVALEFATARADHQRLMMYEDRDRIARNLGDRVIQKIFATGMGIQGIAARLSDASVAAQLSRHVSDMDAVIEQLRTDIFLLQSPQEPLPGDLRMQLMDVIDATCTTTGVQSDVRMSGPIGPSLPAAISDALMAVVRESLTYVADHANGARAGVSLDVAPEAVTLQIAADVEGRAGENGLADLRECIARYTGTAVIKTSADSGLSIRWNAPLSGNQG